MTAGSHAGDASSGTVVYLGLGSNLEDRAGHLAFGLRALRTHGRVTGVSTVYESDPVGYIDQPRFLNMVARFETALTPRSLLDAVLDIERQRGRTRAFPNAPRTLDIDILALGTGAPDRDRWDRALRETPSAAAGVAAGVIREEGLKVPHPRIAERPFVLVPLLELAPELVDPGSGRPFAACLVDLLAERGVEAEAVGAGSERPALSDRGREALGLRRVMNGAELLESADEHSDERPDS